MTTGRVSVIIPVYNGEAYLAEAVKSAIADDWPDKEVLVFDDGSTDGSRAVADRLQRDHPGLVRVLAHPDGGNRGLSHARNAALAAAGGEFVAFLDADDAFLPGHLRRAVSALRATPAAALAYGRVRVRAEGGSSWMDSDEWGWGPGAGVVSYAFELLLRRNFIPVPAVVCRREAVLELGGFDAGVAFLQQDYLLWTRLAYRHAIVYLDAVTSVYRVHPASYSSRLDRARTATAQEVEYLDRMSAWIPAGDASARRSLRQAWQEAADRIVYRLYQALRQGDARGALREARALWRAPLAAVLSSPGRWHATRAQSRALAR
jgi:glycosyltransferase involved in cell wall biosynthesis